MYASLWIAGLMCWYGLYRHHGYRWKTEWNIEALNRSAIRRSLLTFLPCATALFLFAYASIPERLFSLPRERTQLWAMIMVLYPLLSVMPQELIFRSYIFCRFKSLFPGRAMPFASAFAFGWAHILMQNWVAVVFSAIGGYLFARTYRETRSLAAVSFEHALYGCYLFTIGMGYYFYHGRVH